jgi:two-component system, LuxR family, response regulator FixJ
MSKSLSDQKLTMRRLIYLVDDDDFVRDSTAYLLRANDYDVVEYAKSKVFIEELDAARPACIMLDIAMPELDGLQTQDLLNERGIAFPVLILTGQGDVARAVRAMKNGAVEFLEKPYEEGKLLQALDKAFATLDQRMDQGGKEQEARRKIAALSKREREVMQGLLDGMPNKIIAYKLGLSIRTVESFRATLMEKLGVRTVSAAVRLALLAGLPALSEDVAPPL